jgi:tRNA (guanine-N7-)-methyltransferase
MRGSSKLSPAAAAVQWIPRDEQEAFTCSGPLEVDLGCGDGAFLAAIAAEHPDRTFLGVERMIGRVRGACRRIAARQLTNARVLRSEITTALEQHLPPASVDTFHLLFSDPWPKRRHHRRRVFNEQLLESLHRTLKPGGKFHIATDDADYWAAMQHLLREFGSFTPAADAERVFPATTFERRFLERGAEVYRVILSR